MNELLQEIKMLKGVLGVFVYDGQSTILASDVPPNFREPSLIRMGQFAQTFFGNRVAKQQRFSSFELKNDESLLLVKKIDENIFLVTICEPTVSMPLVNMTTSMLLAELKAALAVAKDRPVASAGVTAPGPGAPVTPPPPTTKSPDPVPPPQPPPATPTQAVPAAKIDVDKLMNDGPFAAIARKIENAMSKAIGPVGVMVVRDCVEKWVAGGAPAKNRFNELLGLLLQEIGDQELEEEFKREVGSLFQ